MKSLKLFLKGKSPKQIQRRGARWQRKLKPQAVSDKAKVIFAIPLVSKKRAQNWEVVSANLAQTLSFLRAQTNPNWVAVVCGQDQPDGVVFDDQVQFLPFTGRDKFYDKGDKRVALIQFAKKAFAGWDGYYAQWDGDDLLQADVVEYLLTEKSPNGYLIETGIMADISAGFFGWLGDPEKADGRRPFWRMCGSSSFVRFDFRQQPNHWCRLLLRHSSHLKIVEWMEASGLPLDVVPFPAAIYTFNHGENMSTRRGRNAQRMTYLQANALSDLEVSVQKRAFGLADPSARNATRSGTDEALFGARLEKRAG